MRLLSEVFAELKAHVPIENLDALCKKTALFENENTKYFINNVVYELEVGLFLSFSGNYSPF